MGCWMRVGFVSLVRIAGLVSEVSCFSPIGFALQNQTERRLHHLATPFSPPLRVSQAKPMDPQVERVSFPLPFSLVPLLLSFSSVFLLLSFSLALLLYEPLLTASYLSFTSYLPTPRIPPITVHAVYDRRDFQWRKAASSLHVQFHTSLRCFLIRSSLRSTILASTRSLSAKKSASLNTEENVCFPGSASWNWCL